MPVSDASLARILDPAAGLGASADPHPVRAESPGPPGRNGLWWGECRGRQQDPRLFPGLRPENVAPAGQ